MQTLFLDSDKDPTLPNPTIPNHSQLGQSSSTVFSHSLLPNHRSSQLRQLLVQTSNGRPTLLKHLLRLRQRLHHPLKRPCQHLKPPVQNPVSQNSTFKTLEEVISPGLQKISELIVTDETQTQFSSPMTIFLIVLFRFVLPLLSSTPSSSNPSPSPKPVAKPSHRITSGDSTRLADPNRNHNPFKTN